MSDFEIASVSFYRAGESHSFLNVKDYDLLFENAKSLRMAQRAQMEIAKENRDCLTVNSHNGYYHLDAAVGKELLFLVDTRVPVPPDEDDYEYVYEFEGKTHNATRKFRSVLPVIKAYIETGNLVTPSNHEWLNSNADHR